jgi:PD-(D/E)XK nuclease superfamily
VANTSKSRPKGLHGLKRPDDAPLGLSASDFAFLGDDCPCCCYLKIAPEAARPSPPFPKCLRSDRPGHEGLLPRGAGRLPGRRHADRSSRWVKSSPLALPDTAHTSIIRGRVDVLIDRDDGPLGIVDFKTAVPKLDHVATYARQLHAYAWALEHSASGPPARVSSLGLLCFLPDSYEAQGTRAGALGDIRWIPVQCGDQDFLQFLVEVVSVLEAVDPPPARSDCRWCPVRKGRGADAA